MEWDFDNVAPGIMRHRPDNGSEIWVDLNCTDGVLKVSLDFLGGTVVQYWHRSGKRSLARRVCDVDVPHTPGDGVPSVRPRDTKRKRRVT